MLYCCCSCLFVCLFVLVAWKIYDVLLFWGWDVGVWMLAEVLWRLDAGVWVPLADSVCDGCDVVSS